MNISEIHVADFGAWHDLSLQQLGPGITVFYGPNEAGKTTLLNLVRTVLYGFSSSRCSRYLPPADGSQAGGWLRIGDVSGGEFRIERVAASHYSGGSGTLRVHSDDNGEYGSELLTTLLAGVDETIFNNVFAVGLTQMQQLSTLSDTEAAQQLYGLATGVDRVSIFDVTRDLESQMQMLLPTDEGIAGHLDNLFEIKKRLEKEHKALRRDAGHFSQLRKDYRDLRARIQEKVAATKAIDGEGAWQETSESIRDRWARCEKLHRDLTKLGRVAEVPDAAAERLREHRQQLLQLRRDWKAVRDERRTLKSKASQLKGSHALYQHAAEIEALDRQRDRLIELEHEVRRDQAIIDELEFEIQAEHEELGIHVGVKGKQLPQISDELIEALREPAREARELRRVVESFKALADGQRREAEEVKNKLETASLRFGGEDIEQALQRSFNLVQMLERRINLDEEREDLVRQLDDVEQETSYWRQRTVLPWSGVLTTCAVFSVGAMLLATGWLHEWFDLGEVVRIPMMAIGGSLAVISLVMKGAFEYSAREKADTSARQYELLFEEQGRAQQESAELDQTLPAGSGNLDQRLMDARQKLAELDEFVPLRNRYQELRREADAVDHEAKLSIRQLKDARRAWKASLRAVGLPESLTPAQIGKMSAKVDDVTRLRNRLHEAKLEIADRQQALATIRDRIQELLVHGEVHEVLEGVEQQLNRLVKELAAQSKAGRQREDLKRRWDELKRKQDQIAQLAQRVIQKKQHQLRVHGLTSMRELQKLLAKSRRSKLMRHQLETLLKEIEGQIGDPFSLPKLRKSLERNDGRLLQYLGELDGNRESLGSDLASLYEKSGEMKQKLDGYMTDRRSEKKELELQVVDERIRVALEQWQQAAVASRVLDQIKANYETKRQPVALAEASRHLERLTEGRYVRIWTPMDENALCVDDANQQSITVAKLSRGTRELVYLALRLALVGSYSRRGANMPMVLDDVFVNFDDRRAQVAAKVIADVAKAGQQFLIFTCHKRIQTIFDRLECDVRELPSRDGGPVDGGLDWEPAEAPPVEPAPLPEPVPEVVSEPVPEVVFEPPRVVHEPSDFEEPVPFSFDDEEWDQFQPAWRDEHLVPLPDLVADPHE